MLPMLQRRALSGMASTMKAVRLLAPGGPEQLVWDDAPAPAAPTGRQVRLAVRATAVNRADLLQRQGKYPPPPGASEIIGLEAAGVVAEVGPECTALRPGDRVMALLAGGGYAEQVLVDERHTLPIPAGMPYEQAAAIPEVWLTAYQLLHLVGRVRPGHNVLVHAGASGVGTAAIQLINLAGARAYASVGSDRKADFVRSLGAAGAHNYKTSGSPAPFILEQTGGHGADIILDCIGGSAWQQNVDALAMDGQWVMYGTMGGDAVNGNFFRYLLRKRASLLCTTLRNRTDDYKAAMVAEFRGHALEHFATKRLRPVVDRIYPITRVADAHTYLGANDSIGKVVLTMDAGTPHAGVVDRAEAPANTGSSGCVRKGTAAATA